MDAGSSFLLLRRAVLHCVAWIERRLLMPYFDSRDAWQLFGLGDIRRPADYEGIISNFMVRQPCCCKGGMAKQIREAGVTREELQSLTWRQALYAGALVTRLTVAYVERRHARHRRTSHTQMPWHTFAAASINH